MKFSSFNLKKEVVVNFNKLGYIEATKVQEKCIPLILKNNNLIINFSTGTGKTHVFLIPFINNCNFLKGCQYIIIVPTKELSIQTHNFLKKYKLFEPSLKIKNLSDNSEKDSVNSILNSNFIVTTIGKLSLFIKKFKLKSSDFPFLNSIVVDEIDMFTENNFNELVNLLELFSPKQLITISATINKNIDEKLNKIYYKKKVIRVFNTSTKLICNENINHFFIDIKHYNIFECVDDFINYFNPYYLFIFSNDKEEAKNLYLSLQKKYKTAYLSSDLNVRERKSLFKRINNDDFRIIVSTDLLSRGIDIKNISDVLSLSFPKKDNYYFHRAGRTGRNGVKGNSFTFFNETSRQNITKFIEKNKKINFKYLTLKDHYFIELKKIS